MTIDLWVSNFDTLAPGYRAPTCTIAGSARSSIFHPSAFSLWHVRADLDAGAELVWPTTHGDEPLYVLDGCLEVDGHQCRAGGAIVVEAGAPATVRALAPSQVVHSGTTPGPRAIEDQLQSAPVRAGTVHVFATMDLAREFRAIGRPLVHSFFLDGTCPTCRVAYFVVDGREASDGYLGQSHVHSEDEIIYMIDGFIQIGATRVREGQAVAIPAGRRYGFRSGGPFRFLNYRADVATATFRPGSVPMLETIDALLAGGVVAETRR
jgi:quercetin dioxygenase-like cupin family protein